MSSGVRLLVPWPSATGNPPAFDAAFLGVVSGTIGLIGGGTVAAGDVVVSRVCVRTSSVLHARRPRIGYVEPAHGRLPALRGSGRGGVLLTPRFGRLPISRPVDVAPDRAGPSTDLPISRVNGAGFAPAPRRATVDIAMPVPARQQLEEAAIDCGSVTFHGASSVADRIKRVAFEVAEQSRRLVTIEIDSGDVVVSFYISAA